MSPKEIKDGQQSVESEKHNRHISANSSAKKNPLPRSTKVDRVKRLLGIEQDSPIESTGRILSLRNRKVDVTPSPQKTPRV